MVLSTFSELENQKLQSNQDAEDEGGCLLKEAEFEAEKNETKKKQLSNFAFMCYGSFPTRNGQNGSKLAIVTQKSDKVNKATVISAL